MENLSGSYSHYQLQQRLSLIFLDRLRPFDAHLLLSTTGSFHMLSQQNSSQREDHRSPQWYCPLTAHSELVGALGREASENSGCAQSACFLCVRTNHYNQPWSTPRPNIYCWLWQCFASRKHGASPLQVVATTHGFQVANLDYNLLQRFRFGGSAGRKALK